MERGRKAYYYHHFSFRHIRAEYQDFCADRRAVSGRGDGYLLEDWEADPVATMGKWQSAMDEAHDFAREKGILFGICIPYYLDTEEFPEGVERLINETCDAVFIMNYYKQNEAENIRTEVECARAAGIPVTVIYELQPPGIHGLVEENTYYHDGLEKVEESFLTIRRTLGAEDLYIALHEYGTLRELLRG